MKIDFNKRLENHKIHYKNLEKEAEKFSLFRTISMILCLGTLIYAINSRIVFLVVAIAFVSFIFFVIKHTKIKYNLQKLQHKINFNEKILQRKNGDWHNFDIVKEIFLEESEHINNKQNSEDIIKLHAYAKDIDIFGKNSLYQFINETNTYYGRGMLTEILLTRNDVHTVTARQEAVKELALKIDFCEEVVALAKLENISNDPKELINYFNSKDNIRRKLKYIYFLTIAFVTSAIINIIFPSNEMANIAITLLLLQGIIFCVFLPKTSYALKSLYSVNRGVNSFYKIILTIENEEFSSPLLKTIHASLTGASTFIRKISIIENLAGFRRNFIFFGLLNFLFLWDIQLVVALEKLKEHGDNKENNLNNWLRSVGFIETLISASTVAQAHPNWTLPTITNNNKFQATDIGHPLLHNPVTNNYSQHGISIITGSNMSGKTTLLRSIGVNLVLANIGSVVNATTLIAPVSRIFTCMRTTDSLTENISTFYGELLRIKLIIDESKHNTPMIFLIDEIFRGTNSEDRIQGAKTVLRQLNKPHIIGLITTHDLAICEIATEGNKYKNYNFKEYYENNEIKFDYKIREGISQTRNAKYLMKMVGIEDD